MKLSSKTTVDKIELDVFLMEMDNPSFSWIISHYLLKKGIISDASRNGSIEEKFLQKTTLYTPTVEKYLSQAEFLEYDSHIVIYNRYSLIKKALEDEKPEVIITFGCGLSPLGISMIDKPYTDLIVDTDYSTDVVELRKSIVKSKKYQTQFFELGSDSKIKTLKSLTGNKKTAFVFEGVFSYFDNESIFQIIHDCLDISDNTFIVGDFFVSPKKNGSELIKFPKSSFENIDLLKRLFQKENIKAVHIPGNNINQVVFKCKR